MAKPLSIAALVAACLVLLTLSAAYNQSRKKDDPLAPRRPTRSVEADPASGPCAIVHARFGGRGAQLVKVMKGSVTNFVVIEAGKRDPLLRLQRIDWLRASYDGAEHIWLGEFGSAAAAMVRAARLCPPSLRCLPGDTDCGPQEQSLTPAQIFVHR